MTTIHVAHSPDSDDAFMFYALAAGKIDTEGLTYVHELQDIESLNQRAMRGELEVTAVSIHAYAYLSDRYSLLPHGASMGDRYGPRLVARDPADRSEVKGKRIAIPGRLTTAFLTLNLIQPDFEPVETPFDKILEAVQERKADAGLIIHEAQLTYAKAGFHNVVDLGRWFKDNYELPLPLGANVLRRDLTPEVTSECCRLMRDSIQYALDHREEALNYAMQFARELETPLADKFVGMYVNHYTVDCGELVPKAAQKLLDMGYEAGLIPHRVQLEIVR